MEGQRMQLGTRGQGGRQWGFRPHPLPPGLHKETGVRKQWALFLEGQHRLVSSVRIYASHRALSHHEDSFRSAGLSRLHLPAQRRVFSPQLGLAASFPEVLEEAQVCGWRAGGSHTQRTSCSREVWVEQGRPDSC